MGATSRWNQQQSFSGHHAVAVARQYLPSRHRHCTSWADLVLRRMLRRNIGFQVLAGIILLVVRNDVRLDALPTCSADAGVHGVRDALQKPSDQHNANHPS